MNTLKTFLRDSFPTLYGLLARLKDRFFMERWGNYYDASDLALREPERCLIELAPEIPSHVTRFLNLGCGAGRDFIPFDGKFDLWGIDLVPAKRIKWVRPFKNLRYEQISLQELTKRFEAGGEDLTHTLVYAQGTLMYLNEQEQKRFFAACKSSGGKNYIFQEFPPDSAVSPREKLRLSISGFEKRLYREEGEELPTYVAFG